PPVTGVGRLLPFPPLSDLPDLHEFELRPVAVKGRDLCRREGSVLDRRADQRTAEMLLSVDHWRNADSRRHCAGRDCRSARLLAVDVKAHLRTIGNRRDVGPAIERYGRADDGCAAIREHQPAVPQSETATRAIWIANAAERHLALREAGPHPGAYRVARARACQRLSGVQIALNADPAGEERRVIGAPVLRHFGGQRRGTCEENCCPNDIVTHTRTSPLGRYG